MELCSGEYPGCGARGASVVFMVDQTMTKPACGSRFARVPSSDGLPCCPARRAPDHNVRVGAVGRGTRCPQAHDSRCMKLVEWATSVLRRGGPASLPLGREGHSRTAMAEIVTRAPLSAARDQFEESKAVPVEGDAFLASKVMPAIRPLGRHDAASCRASDALSGALRLTVRLRHRSPWRPTSLSRQAL